MKVCISLGGSVVVPGKVNVKFLRDLKETLRRNKQHRYKIVVGGGKIAREYMNAMACFGVSRREQHILGVKITKVNAYLVAKILGFKYAAELPPQKVAKIAANTVSAGWKPGFTTDVDTALVAKYWKADIVVNITNVKGVYDKDPKRYKNAKFLPKLSYDELIRIQGNEFKPGAHFVFDPRAVEILRKARIPLYVIKGKNNLEKILQGKRFIGSVISET